MMLFFMIGFVVRPVLLPQEPQYLIGDEQIITTMKTLARGIHNNLISDGFTVENRTIPLYYTHTFYDIITFKQFAKLFGKTTVFYSEEYGITPRMFFWFLTNNNGQLMYVAYRVGF